MHDAERAVQDIANIGGVLSWLINTAISAVIGLVWGVILIGVAALIRAAIRMIGLIADKSIRSPLRVSKDVW